MSSGLERRGLLLGLLDYDGGQVVVAYGQPDREGCQVRCISERIFTPRIGSELGNKRLNRARPSEFAGVSNSTISLFL